MPQYAFGTGTMILKRTDVANTPPALLGVLQDVEISISRDLKELMGQSAMPVAIAAAGLKVEGKAKFARLSATQLSNIFLGQAITTGVQNMTVPETATIPGTPFQVTVSNAATFVSDLGVYFTATGAQLTPVASGPVAGQYSVNASGVYTFAAADTAKGVQIFYEFTLGSGGFRSTLTNPLMGSAPVFSVSFQESFNDFGVAKVFYLKLNACMGGKMGLAFKNQDFMIPDFDFKAFADAAGNWGTISLSE